MTDEQLIALVHEALPEELSFEQIEAMRRRLPHCSELRSALAGQLRLEHALGGVLGAPRVSLDWIFAQAASGTAAAGGAARLFGWGPATAMVIAVASVGVMLQRHRAAEDARPVEQVARAVEVEIPALPAVDEPLPEPAGEPRPTEIASPSDQVDPSAPSDEESPAARQAPRAVLQSEAGPQELLAALPPGAIERPLGEQPGWFEELSWRGFEHIERQIEAIEGAHERLAEGAAQRPALVLAALSRLREPWPAGAALRLSLADSKPFRLHLWNGTQGITLARYELPRPAWAAYRSTRRASDLRPQTLALLAVDRDRYRGSGEAAADLRLQDGQLVLSRGDVPLIVVPCSAPPDAVVLEGPAALGGLEIAPCGALPLDAASTTNSLPTNIPEELTWAQQLPAGSQWNALAEGRCELLAEDTSELSWSATAIPDPGLHELVFELEDPMPGTGIYLGDDAGRPVYRLGFFRDEATGRTSFGSAARGDSRTVARHDPSQGPAPYAAVRPWLRLMLGSGWLKCWTSADGRHWSQAIEPCGRFPRGFSTAGLYALPGGGTRCLRVRRLEARKLTGLSGLAAPSVRAQVSGLTEAPTFAAWRQTVLDHCPPDVDLDAWRCACAVELLAVGSRGEMTSAVLLDLLEQTLPDESLPAAARIALLEEAALIFDAGEPALLDAFLGGYDRLGHALARQGHPRPYSAIRRSLLTTPIWTTLPIDGHEEIWRLIAAERAALPDAGSQRASAAP
ncbi:MAG TPA: hypothetical protein VN699_07415 [Pirellulales bacterium]|nr:hypothetical protein [Pirellulales bacterium]